MPSQLLRRRRVHERVKTDQSLRLERRKTDRELQKRAARTTDDADKVVRIARQRAAAVLAEARRQEDRRPADPGDLKRIRVGRARAQADRQLRREYDAADVRTGRERAARVRAFAKLFLAERQLTDERLKTERVRSDKLLAARDELLAQVSHDLRGFLGAIALRLQVLELCISSDRAHPGGDAIRAVQELTATMGRLIGDLLDAGAMESGSFRIKRDDSRLDELLTLSADAFREAAAAKRISLTVSTNDCLTARFDHQRILQVVANLVGNALKFTPPGGRIALRLEAAEGRCLVSVADTGSGIRKDKLESIFDRFTQERRTNGGGLGLGLFIARSIVEAHGGKIWAESRPGRGSTFYFSLPATGSRRDGASGGAAGRKQRAARS